MSAQYGEWPLERLLSEVVGSGPKSAGDMTREQAIEAFERILDDEPDPTALGAFLLANRWKANTPEELAAFVDVMRDRAEQVAPAVDPVDCGANYDGKRRSALLGVGAGIVAAAAGTPVVVHSADRVPTKRGCTYRHVLDALRIPTDLAPAESARMVDDTGFGFYYAPRFNPAVHALLDRRERVGVRTFINTVETLANPADARVHLGSFFHLPFAVRVIEAVAESRTLDLDRVMVIQGLEGYDDLRPGHTTVAEWRGDGIDDYAIEPADYGLDLEAGALDVGDIWTDSARLTERVLSGEADGRFPQAIALNAAVRIYAGGGARTLTEGLELAREALADGSPADVLKRLRGFEAR